MDATLAPPAPTRTPPASVSSDRWVLAPARRLRRRRITAGNAVFVAAVLGAALAWALTLRPLSLGGPVDYVMVQGVSMEPTFHSGDLVLAWREDSYRKGDVVAYRVPQGDVGAGSIVIHRIIGGSPRTGFVMQGDNNPVPDDWHPRPADIVGKARVRVPRFGTIFTFLHAPLPLASLATGIAVALLLVPDDGKRRKATTSKDPARD